MIRFRQRRISRIYGNDAVRRAIGVRVRYQQCSMDVAMQFRLTGDSKHLLLSFIAKELINLIDLRCPLLPPNPLLPPPIQPIHSPSSSGPATQTGSATGRVTKPLQSYTVNGTQRGLVKSVDRFVFMRVFEAGHEVPYYRNFSLLKRGQANWIEPETALQVFVQVMQGDVHST